MEAKHIQELLDRYWEGRTSQEEEQALKEFFAQKKVPESLAPYQALFAYLDIAGKWKSSTSGPSLGSTRPLYKRPVWQGVSIAATLFFVLGIGYYFQQQPSPKYTPPAASIVESIHGDTYKDPEEAYEAAKEALLLVSQKLKGGTNWIEQFRKGSFTPEPHKKQSYEE